MNKKYKRSFIKDINKIGRKDIRKKLEAFILQVESASSVEDLPHTIKMKGTINAYRARIGNYTIGLFYDKTANELLFVRFLKRNDIYKLFP